MTDQTTNLHTTFQDNLDTYLTGGLSATEATIFESHAALCPDCAAELATARRVDKTMQSLFAPLVPSQDFEDRLISGLHKPPTVRRLHPMVRLAASGVAAAVVLGAVGHYGGRAVNRGDQYAARAKLAANLKQVGEMMQLHTNEQRSSRDVPASGSRLEAGDLAFHDQTSVEGRNRALGDAARFNFFYQTAGENSATKQRQAESLVRRVEPNGVRNLDWKQNRVFEAGLVGDENAGVQTRSVTGKETAIQKPADQRYAYYEPQWAQDALVSSGKADSDKLATQTTPAANGGVHVLAENLVGSGKAERSTGSGPTKLDFTAKDVTVAHGAVQSDGQKQDAEDIKKFADALHDKSKTELEAAGVDRKSASAQAVAPALAAAQPSAAAPGLVGSAPTAPPPASDSDNIPPTTQPSITTSAAAAQKIIRTGAMEFEVDSFDSAFVQITKIAAEEGAFVSSTDSDKLENGKVKGTVTLRCPPEHLDTLVLKLRGLGDLKTQRITAQDVTKQFTDYESQLRAARAMEDRLLEIIKTGKGTVKDLVEAEKQLGIYREKIEQIEGELRYMGSQVALSTLSVSLMERDIRTPFAAVEAEQISAGIEVEDVERARTDALKLIDDAKGRVIESELKKLDAGQLAATLIAEVSPDAADALGDRLKQLGHVARWEATRKQTTEGGNGSPTPLQSHTKLERQPTRFSVSIYNLANVAPRQTTSLTLVTNDVEAAYRSILAAMNGDGKTPAIGRIVTSNLAAQKSDQVTGAITLEVKSDQIAAIESAIHTAGSVMHLTVTENPDQNGVTGAKIGYGLTLIAAANVPAREQQAITVASKDVGGTYNKLLTLLRDPKESARVINSQLSEPQEDNVTGSVDCEIPIVNRAAVDAVLSDGKQSDVISRNVARSADTENTLADKLRLTVNIGSAERLPPRETTQLTLETSDVAKALDTAADLGGSDVHVTERSLSQQPDGRSSAHVAIDVPLSAAQTTLDELRSLGKVASAESARDAKVTAGPLARARFEVELENAQTLVPPQDGMSASVQRGLRTALNGLLWSVQMVVVGLVLVVPFLLVIWAAWRLVRRARKNAGTNPGGA